MKKFLLLILVCSLYSCSTQPECSSFDTTWQLRQLIEQEMNKNDLIAYTFNSDDKYKAYQEELIKSYVNDLDFKYTRKVSQDKELERCECETSLVIDPNSIFDKNVKLKKFFSEKNNESNIYINKINNFEVPLSYTVQNTSVDEFYLEAFIPEEIYSLFFLYLPIWAALNSDELEDNNDNQALKDSESNDQTYVPDFEYDNSKWDYCYDLKEKGMRTILHIAEIPGNKITGIYDIILYYDAGSWGGKIEGEFLNPDKTKIKATGEWYGEGEKYEVELIIELFEEKAIVTDIKDNGHYSNTLERTPNCIK